MRGSARHIDARHSNVRPASTASLGARSFDISPEDRIGPPLTSARARAARRLVFIALVAAIGWAWFQGHVQLPAGTMDRLASLVSAPAQKIQAGLPPSPGSHASGAVSPADNGGQRLVADSAPQDEARLQATAAPQAAALTQPVEINRAADTPPAPQKSDEELSAPREPADPIQKRAAAAGLSPDLSRALLARLSAADLDNAAAAIRTAMVETPDDGVLVWPKQRKPEQALFKVHFVQGAASPECRRYVVTVVTRDGWSTTAPPMERCGLARKPAAKG